MEDPGIEPGSPALQADSLLSEPPGMSTEGLLRVALLVKMNINEIIKMKMNRHSEQGLEPLNSSRQTRMSFLGT